MHLRARDYDPTTGSFLSRDPLDGVTGTSTVANPYHYADNDPANRHDPTGLQPGDPPLTDSLFGAPVSRTRSFTVPHVRDGGRVRIGQFIMEKVVSQFGLALGRGDNRTFNRKCSTATTACISK